MKIRQILLIFWVVTGVIFCNAQTADVPLNHPLYHYVDRLDIKGLFDGTVHTDYKPYNREDISDLFENVDESGMGAREKKWHDLMRISGDDAYADSQDGKGIFKQLYLNKRDFYAVKKENLRIYINPAAYLSAGTDQHNYTSDLSTTSLSNYRNTRSVVIRGSIMEKIGFYTDVSENQVKYPQFIRNEFDSSGVLFGESFVKQFDTNTPNPGYDYFSAKGYINFKPIKQMRVKLGKDRAFLGNGYQSLHLSDYATDYFFLNLNTRIWKLEYINHYTIMTDFFKGKPDSYGTYPKKYGVFHELFYKPKKWASIGFFESVIYAPSQPGGYRGFEIEYLNPIIFYRSVEQALGSPDNAMMGLSWKLNMLKRFQLYGQISLDDFNWRIRSQGKGYMGNKYGYQAGLKYIDAFSLTGLDLQMEYNRIRPYTYSHFNPSGSYSQYGQSLAHTMGANLYDMNFILRYQPVPRLQLTAIATRLLKGMDQDGLDYGGDISKPYTLAFLQFSNFGHYVGQGNPVNVTTLYGRLSYRILQMDAWADIEARVRKENEYSSFSLMGSIRWNMSVKPVKF